MAEVELEKSAMRDDGPDGVAPLVGAGHLSVAPVIESAIEVVGNGRGPRWYGYTAFVLSGGGARGALQVGALRALLEAGIRPDVIVGTSIGAWNGALLA